MSWLTKVEKPSFSAWAHAAMKVFFPVPGAKAATGPSIATFEPLAHTSANVTPTILPSLLVAA